MNHYLRWKQTENRLLLITEAMYCAISQFVLFYPFSQTEHYVAFISTDSKIDTIIIHNRPHLNSFIHFGCWIDGH